MPTLYVLNHLIFTYWLLITLRNESYYINSRLESRLLREQIKCFYYILVTFCINIHFSWILISFAWIKVICAKNRCMIVDSQFMKGYWGIRRARRGNKMTTKGSKAQSRTNQCYSNLGVMRKKTWVRIRPKIVICMFPKLKACTLMGFGFNPNLHYKKGGVHHIERRKAREGNYHQSN